MDLIDRPIVLRLNRSWQAIGVSTVKDALIAMNSGDDLLKAATAINIQYPKKDDGSWDFDNPELLPTSFEDWIKLPVREDIDNAIHTSKLTIRVPTVIVAVNFAKMPKVQKHPTKANIRERDKSRCQVSGKLLAKKEGNIDHIVPRSRGGRDTWENLIWMDKDLNAKKGNKTLEEMGWKVLKKPVAPKEMPLSATIRHLQHQDWRFFIEH
jgi:5-methylcytosine-specific restriction endonuclease McrA